MNVLKFGGTSVADAECIRQVKYIVESSDANKYIVVSAMSGVTDMLLRAYKQAVSGSAEYKSLTCEICERHLQAAEALVSPQQQLRTFAAIKELTAELNGCLHDAAEQQIFSPQAQDYALSFGERMNSYLISNIIGNAQWVDVRRLIKTDSHFGNAKVDFTETYRRLATELLPLKGRAVIPGFIASDKSGITTTLGRGGSDYTAALVASAVSAQSVEIWTDTDGFMTADPRRVSNAHTIPQMTYAEVFELAKFGAKVVYPPTVYPLLMSKIPMYIKNTFNPQGAGTLVGDSKPPQSSPVVSVSAMDAVVVFTLRLLNADASEVSERLCAALAEMHIEAMGIEQSAQSVRFIAMAADEEVVHIAIERTFRDEIGWSKITIEVQNDLSLLAIVGENLHCCPDMPALLCSTLHTKGVEAAACAYGRSGISVLLAVPQNILVVAIALIHDTFFNGHTSRSLNGVEPS
jgi:aspartokinase/homoserine dehydrogenase 1